MATQEASGTTTITTIGTAQTVATITTAKPFQAFVDISALAAGEYLQVKILRKVLAGGVSGVAFDAIYSWLDALMNPIVMAPALLSTQEYDLVLNQLTGIARAFPWAVETP